LALGKVSAPPRRILALDVGDRRIGLAVSDPLGYTAQPLFTLHRTHLRADLKSIARVLRKHAVTELVIGLPLYPSGELSPQAIKVQTFAEAMRNQHPSLRFHFIDERFTSAEAHALLDRSHPLRHNRSSRQQRTAVIDQIAAVILLESFLAISAPPLLPPPPGLEIDG